MKNIIPLLVAIACAACAPENKTETKRYSYEYIVNGCSTERHEFDSQDALCEGLRNDDLNRGCASVMRYRKFEAECAGKSWN